MLRRDEVDVVDSADVLELHVPFSKLLGREVEALPLVCNIVVLAEDAAEVAAREEDGARAIVALDAGLYVIPTTSSTDEQYKELTSALSLLTFTKVGSDHIDLHRLRPDQADSSLLISIHSAQSGAEIAIA